MNKTISISFPDHGRFVSPDGILTRTEQIEWEQMPLEFSEHIYQDF